MNQERWKSLMADAMHGGTMEVTEEEFKAGWHSCNDWDGMIVGPDMGECVHCHCQNEFGDDVISKEQKEQAQAEMDRLEQENPIKEKDLLS